MGTGSVIILIPAGGFLTDRHIMVTPGYVMAIITIMIMEAIGGHRVTGMDNIITIHRAINVAITEKPAGYPRLQPPLQEPGPQLLIMYM